MTWYVPFDKLGVKQVEVLNGITKQLERPHWVQGFAGTGKTLVVTHLMERVAQLKPGASICFITFTHALKDLVKSGLHGNVAKRVQIKTHTQFISDRTRYDYVFLDEVQDIRPTDLTKIRALAANLYIAGDTDQRIYTEGANEDEVVMQLQPTKWKLLEIFRLTKLLQRLAQSILPRTMLVEGVHAKKHSEVTISLAKHSSSLDESLWVWREASRRARAGEPSVILFPTHKAIARFAREVAESLDLDEVPRRQSRDYEAFNAFWKSSGLNLMYFGNNQGDLALSDNRPFVYLMTFHSSKGLDFRNVFIPGMRANAVIVHPDALLDDPELEQRLLFVAVTRSRENLFISYSGDVPHPLLEKLPKDVIAEISPKKPGHDQNEQEEFF
jgi:superfamily I DNA/RNA helicase